MQTKPNNSWLMVVSDLDECRSAVARFSAVIRRDQVGEGNVGWAAKGPRTSRGEDAEVARSRAGVAGIQGVPSRAGEELSGVAVLVPAAVRTRIAIFPPRFEEYGVRLRAIWRRRRQRARHGSETPLLDVGLDENEAGLTEVDVYDARPVRADGGEEVLCLQSMDSILHLLAVSCEENRASPGPVADANNIALHNLRTVGSCCEGLVIAAGAVGQIGNRIFVEALATN